MRKWHWMSGPASPRPRMLLKWLRANCSMLANGQCTLQSGRRRGKADLVCVRCVLRCGCRAPAAVRVPPIVACTRESAEDPVQTYRELGCAMRTGNAVACCGLWVVYYAPCVGHCGGCWVQGTGKFRP